MNTEIKMSVSAMTRKDDKKGVYVLFTDENNTAEFMLPECKLVNNAGFSDEDINRLKDYLDNQQEYIFSLAKQINPLKSFIE